MKLSKEVLAVLFKKDGAVNEEAISFIHKYNLLMSHSSLSEACDKNTDFVLQITSFGIQEFTSALLAH